MALDGECDIWMLLQEIGIALQRGLLVRIDIALVIIEVNVLHRLREQFFLGGGGLGRRCGTAYRDSCRCRLCPSRSLGGESVSGRIGRSYSLRAIGLHRANSIDARVRRIARLPG